MFVLHQRKGEWLSVCTALPPHHGCTQPCNRSLCTAETCSLQTNSLQSQIQIGSCGLGNMLQMHVMKFYANVWTADVLLTGFVVCVCLILLNVASTWTPQGTRLRLQSTLALKNTLVLGVIQLQNKETLLNDERCPMNVVMF